MPSVTKVAERTALIQVGRTPVRRNLHYPLSPSGLPQALSSIMSPPTSTGRVGPGQLHLKVGVETEPPRAHQDILQTDRSRHTRRSTLQLTLVLIRPTRRLNNQCRMTPASRRDRSRVSASVRSETTKVSPQLCRPYRWYRRRDKQGEHQPSKGKKRHSVDGASGTPPYCPSPIATRIADRLPRPVYARFNRPHRHKKRASCTALISQAICAPRDT